MQTQPISIKKELKNHLKNKPKLIQFAPYGDPKQPKKELKNHIKDKPKLMQFAPYGDPKQPKKELKNHTKDKPKLIQFAPYGDPKKPKNHWKRRLFGEHFYRNVFDESTFWIRYMKTPPWVAIPTGSITDFNDHGF